MRWQGLSDVHTCHPGEQWHWQVIGSMVWFFSSPLEGEEDAARFLFFTKIEFAASGWGGLPRNGSRPFLPPTPSLPLKGGGTEKAARVGRASSVGLSPVQGNCS
jgi:hypothetical protein